MNMFTCSSVSEPLVVKHVTFSQKFSFGFFLWKHKENDCVYDIVFVLNNLSHMEWVIFFIKCC